MAAPHTPTERPTSPLLQQSQLTTDKLQKSTLFNFRDYLLDPPLSHTVRKRQVLYRDTLRIALADILSTLRTYLYPLTPQGALADLTIRKRTPRMITLRLH